VDGPDLYVDDASFVRAPPVYVYRRLADPSSYEEWWPGFRLIRAAPAGSDWEAEARETGGPQADGLIGRPREPGESSFSFELRVGRFRRLRIDARPYRFRQDKGLYLALTGDLEGVVEWWLQASHGGTHVHHLARADVRRGSVPRTVAAYRAAVRASGWGLKDQVQSEVRAQAGLAP
jgi:uncharacterized protein YndB with AHSA1/START domain